MCRRDLLYDKLWLLKGEKKNLSTQKVGCPSMAYSPLLWHVHGLLQKQIEI